MVTRPSEVTKPRIAIIGAGAAGLMAAVFAARSGAETILLERTAEGGRKVLISGGGRCNILPSELETGWPLQEQIDFFEQELQLPLEKEA